ncbi:MAG: lysophospholipid acyltransferase family protein [Elusimicrobia bacterium]|nr:lysophospholipid acyltransferase family protein [Elusimicrobiota bacterium]
MEKPQTPAAESQGAEPETDSEERTLRESTLHPERIPYRGPVFHFFWPFTRYIVTSLSAVAAVFFFKVLNRTIVIGKENVGVEQNTLLLPNHQSMIDGFLVGAMVFFPRSLLKPELFPWLPAAWENFFENPVMRWFSDNWRCIPVKKGRKDVGAMLRMEACLRDGIMIVFPEGTRTRDGKLLPPRSGIGYVMLKTRPKAIPVCMDGMSGLQPIGHFWPRVFRTILICYGKPVDLAEFYSRPVGREAAQDAIEKVFAEVGRLQKVLARYRRVRRRRLAKLPWFCRLYKP